MKIIRLVALLLLVTSTAEAITIATVPVGNAGNVNDSFTGYQFGGVSYNYSIGTYDVTVGQYTAFLNAVAATDTYGLYNPSMATDLNVAGIQQNPTPSGFTYSVIGSANHPITYVSWGDAARFANWLNNGQPGLGGAAVPQNAASTEDGTYFLNGATTDAALNAVTRKATATWVIPTENEWYKAAYNIPNTSSYYHYPFSSNTVPTSAMPGSTPNTGNFYGSSYAVTGSSSLSSSQNYLTDVGSYSASASPYGAFDMGGDVFQWNETLFDPSDRGLRGGSWSSSSGVLASAFRDASFGLGPAFEDSIIGFRVASVPASPPFVLGDFNRDDHVDSRDITAMEAALTNLPAYQIAKGLTNAQLLAIGDINNDGVINNADLQAFLNYIKSGGGSNNSVPEPSTLVLAVLAFGLVFRRRLSDR